jgi:hypothetical protein
VRTTKSEKQLKLARLLGFWLACAACSHSGKESSLEASVAETRAAQSDFRKIHRTWNTLRPDERGRLRAPLEAFLERHPEDRRARVARVYLAWIHVQSGQVARARELVSETRQGPAGSARDFALVAEAAILVREGKPGRALDVLKPLDGKIVDAEERSLFSEQRVLAAMAARRGAEAIAYLRDWLAHAAPEDRDAVQERARSLTQEIDSRSLEQGLGLLDAQAKKSQTANPELSQARDFLRKLVRDRLVRIAIERNDGELARRLLDAGIAGMKGEQAAELARIAAAGSVVPRVRGRSVGVVLSVSSAENRRRSAELVLGVSRALGLPESAGDRKAVQLVTSEDDGRPDAVSRALAELAGEGAAVLVAGVDTRAAIEASRYAERARIPVLVLEYVPVKDDGFTFVVGADRAVEAATLEAGVRSKRTGSEVVVLGGGGIACDVAPVAAGMPRFPVQDWKKRQVHGLIVLGDANCARDAARELGSVGHRPLLGLGLECAEIVDELASDERLVVSTGVFPYRAKVDAPESLKRYADQSGHGPTWYAALGHDAARLVQKALASLALDEVVAADDVSARHREARRLLGSASAELWTSERKGFLGGRVLERKLGITDVGRKK